MARASAAARMRRPHSTQNDETRGHLLNAARAVVMRDGYNAASFSRIAEEAGVEREAVFNYFRSKAELVVATIADDLTVLARSMREATTVRTTPPDKQFTQTVVKSVEPQQPDDTAADEILAVEKAAEPDRKMRRDAALARVRETLSRSEAQPVDAWLERRLRVFEKTLAELDERQDAVERACRSAVESAQETVATLRDEMRQLEKKQHDATQGLRNQVLDMSGRLEAVERPVVSTYPDDFTQASIREDVIPESDSHVDADTGTEAGTDTDTEAEAAPGGTAQHDIAAEVPEQESYLSIARRAAMAAAVLSDIEERPQVRFARYLRRPYVYYAGGIAIVLALLLTGLLLNHALARSPISEKAQLANIALAASPGFADKRKTHRTVSLARLEALAKGGTTHAALILGLKYLEGSGVPRDDTKAARWLRASAAQGEPLAEYKLATLYHHGRGVKKDLALALRWYEAAAMQGNREAMHDLGVAYAEGWGTAADPKEAARWFTRAASFGFVNSQFNLAVVYERGFGVPQSLAEAYKWYAIAAANGDKEAQTRVDVLKTQVPPADLAIAQAKADAFKPMPLNQSANSEPKWPLQARG